MEKQNEENPQRSARFLRQRKFLLIAPVLVVPFLILLLWTTGLVGNAKAETATDKRFQGLNLNLPSAAPAKDSNWNKLRYYEQADKDSAKLRSQLKNDPFFQSLAGDEEAPSMKGVSEADYAEMLNSHESPAGYKQDKNEKKVYQKLARLQQEINREPEERPAAVAAASSYNPDVDRLEHMMQQMTQDKDQDPELGQLNGMLEKIMDIQNPERVQDKIRKESEQNKKQAFTVQAPQEDVVSVLEPKKDFAGQFKGYDRDSLPESMRQLIDGNRFYSLDEASAQNQGSHAIAAMIPETQTLVSGATVKMRLLEDVYVAGNKIPKNHFVYGKATLNGERLQIAISSIGYDNNILPVALTVYDKKDGLAGISVKGAITRDVAKNSAAQSMQGLGMINTLDPSFGAQMATAGLNMAQNLVGRTAKLVRVTVEAGYPVLLKDDNQKDK